jgi:hypothetical protein
MRKVTFLKTTLLLVLVSLLATSCFNITEEIYLNEDGSGEYTVTVDMSDIYTLAGDEFLKGFLAGLSDSGMEDEYQLALGDSSTGEIDTTLYYDAVDGSGEGSIHLRFSKSEGIGIMAGTNRFDDIRQVENFMSDELLYLFEYDGKTLVRKPTKFSYELTEEERENPFLTSMLSNASYTVIYHFPRKVKKTSIPGAEIDGKRLIMETSMLDLVDEKSRLDGKIWLKRK